jgi:ribosome-binding factor A
VAKKSFKKDKYEGRMQNEINNILRTQLSDLALQFVSVTKVEMNHDFTNATISWDTFDSTKRGDAKKAIDKSKGRIRTLLAKSLDLRQIPNLSFKYDSQFESEQEITDLLNDEEKKGRSF